MNYKDYKKRRKNVTEVLDRLKETNDAKKNDYKDPRFYQYTKDKTGNAFAVIRFLPSMNEKLGPVVGGDSRYVHSFKHNGNWYIENCPTSRKGKCPVCEDNSELWNTGTKDNQDLVRSRSRRKEFFANIYVLKDSQNPDAEGKVFLWKFGQKVYTKIMEKLKPQFEDEQAVDIFDLDEGANFKLKIKTVGGYANYDGCEFMEVSPLFDDESKYDEVLSKIVDLGEFIDEKNFKDYDTLKARFEKVVRGSAVGEENKDEDTDTTPETEEQEQTPAPKKDKPVEKKVEAEPEVEEDDGDEEDPDDYFKSLNKF